jgi:hypothetical protein
MGKGTGGGGGEGGGSEGGEGGGEGMTTMLATDTIAPWIKPAWTVGE